MADTSDLKSADSLNREGSTPSSGTIYCEDFKGYLYPAFCCGSCHDDDEDDGETFWIRDFGGMTFYICCGIAEALRLRNGIRWY